MERISKKMALEQKSDEDKESEEMFQEIIKVPGWTGDHAKDSLNPGIQTIIRRRMKQKKG